MVALTFFSFANLIAQNISGVVSDENGEPLPGASVLVVGSTNGTTTDFDGNYSINIDDDQIENGQITISASFMGYLEATQTFNAGDDQVWSIQLKPDASLLEDVVVIGYGTVKKDDATGSVAVIGSEDFQKGAISSPQALIVGKTAGVVVTTHSGAPGAGATIRIRGGSSLNASNDPLIVVDGFPLDNEGVSGLSNPLSTINPNDIASFSILKDASATAIYGSRASNGVILITTKQGSKAGIKVSYNGNMSVGTSTGFVDVLDGNSFRTLIKDRVDNHGLTDFALTRLGDANTDWQNEIYSTSFSTDHNLSIFGNAYGWPVRASVGYTIENGILNESSMNRTTLSVNTTPTFFNDRLKMTINAKGMNIGNNFSNTGAIGSGISFDPTQPIKNGNTRYGGYSAWVELSEADQLNGLPNNIATHNPAAQLVFKNNTSDANRFIGNLKFDYEIVKGLRANLNLGYDYTKSAGDDNNTAEASWGYREPEQNITHYEQTKRNELLNFFLNYNTKAGDHNIDLVGGYEWQHFYRDSYNANKAIGQESWDKELATKSENYLISFFGRVNYDYKGKYLLTATMRADGSSRFSEDNRWGLFPAVAAAWKIKEESFLKDVDAVSKLKLKLGYGITGQQDVFNNYYPYIPIYMESTQGAFYQFGDKFYSTLRPNPYDPNIKWEETTTINIGMEFGFLNDKLTGSFDVYRRETKDLISQVPIAAGTNFSNFLTTNVGSLENNGFEVELNYHIVSTTDWNVEIGANLSVNRNEITYLGGQSFDVGGISGGVGNNVQYNTVGMPRNTFYLFNQVYNEAGMPIEGLYVDKTGNGGDVTADNDNKYLLGNPDADYLVGLNGRVAYKNFDFSFAGRLSVGNEVYNNINSSNALYSNLYSQSGFTQNIPSAISQTNFQNAQYWSDIYLEDASFFRMDNISFGYNFTKFISDKINGRVSATVQNAFVITNYSGLDPEVDGGIDNNIYPRPRTFMLGVNLNF